MAVANREATPTSVPATLTRSVEVAVRLAPTPAAAARAARQLASVIADHPGVAIRLAGVESVGPRFHLTIAISLGEIDDVRTADTPSRAAVAALDDVIAHLGAFDPALVAMPRPESDEAYAARALVARHRGIDEAALVALSEDLLSIG